MFVCVYTHIPLKTIQIKSITMAPVAHAIAAVAYCLFGSRGIHAGDCTDPSRCRMAITADSVLALSPNALAAVVMRYDLATDPAMNNKRNDWDKGVDVYGKTSYGINLCLPQMHIIFTPFVIDYTQKDGPLGISGPLGFSGPLGSLGALPHRFVGTTPADDDLSYWNNWCPAAPKESDKECVYGSFGPLVSVPIVAQAV